MLAAPKGLQQNCYKCKINPATSFTRVASCSNCLRNKVISGVNKVWNTEYANKDQSKEKIKCTLIADPANRWRLFLTAIQSISLTRRPEVIAILTKHPIDINDGNEAGSLSSEIPIIDTSSTIQKVIDLLPKCNTYIQEALEWRVYARITETLNGDVIIAPHCQEEVAARVMGKMIRGDFSLLTPSLHDFFWSTVAVEDAKPISAFMPFGRTSIEELEDLSGTKSAPGLGQQSTDIHCYLDSFFKERMTAYPSVASNVCRTTDKLPSSNTVGCLTPADYNKKMRGNLCALCCQALVKLFDETWMPVTRSTANVNVKLCVECESYKDYVSLIDKLIY